MLIITGIELTSTPGGDLMLSRIILFLIVLVTTVTLSFAENAPPETSVYLSSSFGDNNYHLSFCPKVNKGFGKQKVKLQYAIDKNRMPCKKCKPPTGITHRLTAQKTRIGTASSSKRIGVGDSAADIERDADGTAVGSGGAFGSMTSNYSTSTEDPNEEFYKCEVLSIKAETTESRHGFDTIMFDVTAKNISRVDQSVTLLLQAVDNGDTEVASAYIECTIPGGKEQKCSGKGLVKTAIAETIKEWRTK